MSVSHESIKLGVFDINGTIHTDKTGIPEEITTGFANLHDQQISTTIITGRGVRTAESLLGDNRLNIVSSGVPISVENGSRLVAPDGQNLRHYPLSEDEITAAVDGIRTAEDEIDYIAYYSDNPQAKALGGAALLLGSGHPQKNLLKFYKQHGLYRSMGSISKLSPGSLASVFPETELVNQIRSAQPSMIIIGANPKKVAPEFCESNVIANGVELNIMSEGIDKAKGVEDLADFLDLSLAEVLVAGNDHNDLTMLGLPVGKAVFVGTRSPEMPLVDSVEIVSEPRALGVSLNSTEPAEV